MTSPRRSNEGDRDAETLASLMDGTLTADQLDDVQLGRLLRTHGADGLVRAIAEAPKLFAEDDAVAMPVAPRRSEWAAARSPVLAAAAALIVVAAAAAVYFRSLPVEQPEPGRSSTLAVPASDPPVTTTARLPTPIILTARLDERDPAALGEFRGPGSDGRTPKAEGQVVSIDDNGVTIDVGALDGLEKGAVVPVYREFGQEAPAGTLTITRVFRERATGTAVPSGSLRVGDRTAVAASARVDALLDRAAALMAAGDLEGARAEAVRAVSMLQPGDADVGRARRAYARLGTLEHRLGAFEAAERALRSAVDMLGSAPSASSDEASEVLNELGAVLIARGNHVEAGAILRRAQTDAPAGPRAVRILNNLGAVAVLEGDLVTAEKMYRTALALTGSSPAFEPERDAIAKNLQSMGAR
jgi:Tfp pilus assembly protein PilF